MNLLTNFSGIILTGGASRRMGADKALLPVPSRSEGGPRPAPAVPLVTVAATALHAAGAHDITCIGGDQRGIEGLGLAWHPDDHPGEGPLGGLVTGLRVAAMPIVVVLTCDLPAIDGPSVRGLVAALTRASDADAAMPALDDRLQILTAAYRRSVLPVVEAAFAAGERSVRRAVAPLTIEVVDHLDPDLLIDVDSPGDLDQYARRLTTKPSAAPSRAADGPAPPNPGEPGP
jgi:molybdopterin-guanine dinucleotide biosynthesis protein A